VRLAFTQPDATTITIALTARTKHPDPNTGTYHYYTLSETIYKRN
jgi:hypothetical protein